MLEKINCITFEKSLKMPMILDTKGLCGYNIQDRAAGVVAAPCT